MVAGLSGTARFGGLVATNGLWYNISMGRPRKAVEDRVSIGVSLSLTPAEAECFDAYCTAKGFTRADVIRRFIRRASLSALSPEALEFRRLQNALPPLED